MVIKEILKEENVLAFIVPLSIKEIGIAYLNDIGLWSITINSTHKDINKDSLTNKQLQTIFKNHAHAHISQTTEFETRRQQVLAILSKYDDNESLTIL